MIKSITQPTRVCRLYKTRRLNRRIFSTRERLPSLRLTNDRLKIGFLSCSPRCRGCIFECAVSSVSMRRRAVSHVSTESIVSTKKPKRCSPSFVQHSRRSNAYGHDKSIEDNDDYQDTRPVLTKTPVGRRGRNGI